MTTVIQIRGTSGSGKSTVMREVLKRLNRTLYPVYRPRRRNPLYYKSEGIIVLGHYESPSGGGDTIGNARAIYQLIQQVITEHDPAVVLAEGLLLSEDVKWSSQLNRLKVVFLTTPIDTCLERIRKRRLSVGNTKPLNTFKTVRRVKVIERARQRLTEAGVECRRVTCEQAPDLILRWIRESINAKNQD